jgi:Protein of unknown function (DUF751)
MYLWENFSRFPKFFISILTGFFLTTFYFIFKLLKNKRTQLLFYGLLIAITSFIFFTLKFMLGYTA